jgi:hypothetical protein
VASVPDAENVLTLLPVLPAVGEQDVAGVGWVNARLEIEGNPTLAGLNCWCCPSKL